MTEYSNTRAVGNNFPLKKFHQEGRKMFFNTLDGKIILDCQIFSSYVNDGIFRH
jgi:hypothetical protein